MDFASRWALHPDEGMGRSTTALARERIAAAAERRVIDVVELGVADAQRALDSREYSSRELTQAYLDRIAAIDRNGPTLNSGTGIAAVTGTPSLTVPMGDSRGLPLGMTFIGRAFAEPMLLARAHGFECATRARRPPQFVPSLVLDSPTRGTADAHR